MEAEHRTEHLVEHPSAGRQTKEDAFQQARLDASHTAACPDQSVDAWVDA
jgi:hypothetical protein